MTDLGGSFRVPPRLRGSCARESTSPTSQETHQGSLPPVLTSTDAGRHAGTFVRTLRWQSNPGPPPCRASRRGRSFTSSCFLRRWTSEPRRRPGPPDGSRLHPTIAEVTGSASPDHRGGGCSQAAERAVRHHSARRVEHRPLRRAARPGWSPRSTTETPTEPARRWPSTWPAPSRSSKASSPEVARPTLRRHLRHLPQAGPAHPLGRAE